jgi:hypothetical protein
VDALVLVCGPAAASSWRAAFGGHTGVRLREVPAKPARTEVDPILASLDVARLVVLGTDADLAAVVLRLMRTDRLADVAVGFVPVHPARSAVASRWGLPGRDAMEVALDGGLSRVPLIRDDAGGVLLGLGELRRVHGEAYCDDQLALRGRATRIEVSPDIDGGTGLVVKVLRTAVLPTRATTFRGRAVQVGCDPVTPIVDGLAHPRPVRRWTWYRHTEDLLAARA